MVEAIKTVVSLIGLLVAMVFGPVDIAAPSGDRAEAASLLDDEVLSRVITMADDALGVAALAVPPAPTAVAVDVAEPTPAPVIVVPAAGPVATPAPTAAPAPTVAPAPTAAPAPTVAAAPPVVVDHLQRGQAALARVPVQPAALGFSISFEPTRPGYGGLTWPQRKHIDIFVNPDWSEGHLVHVIAHEIGHALDLAQNSRSDHDAWRAIRGMDPGTSWWADPYTSDFASPSGDFAECFAAWAVASGSNRSHFGSCAGTGALMSQLVAG